MAKSLLGAIAQEFKTSRTAPTAWNISPSKIYKDVKQGISTPGGYLGSSKHKQAVKIKGASTMSSKNPLYGTAYLGEKAVSTGPQSNMSNKTASAKYTGSSPKSSYGSQYTRSSGGSSSGVKAGMSAYEKQMLQEQERQAKFRRNLGKAYGSFEDTLREKSSFLTDEENRLTQGINDLFSSYKDTAAKEQEGNLSEISDQRKEAEAEQRKSLRELAENTRKSFMAGNANLGRMGASDSSAAGMYSLGLTGEANQNRRTLLEKAKTLFTDIDAAEKRVKETHDLELGSMDTWIKNNIQQIKDDFAENRKGILDLMENSDEYEQSDLEAMDQQNLNKAYASMQDLEGRAKSWRAMLGQWRDDTTAKITSMKQALIDKGKFTPQELKMDEIDDTLKYDANTDYEDFYNPKVKNKKKLVHDFLNNPLTEEELDY